MVSNSFRIFPFLFVLVLIGLSHSLMFAAPAKLPPPATQALLDEADALAQQNRSSEAIAKLKEAVKEEQSAREQTETELIKVRKISRTIQVLAVFLAIAGIIAVVFLIILYRRRNSYQQDKTQLQTVQKRLTESELRNKKMEGEKLRTELDLKKKDLTDLAIDISRKRDWGQQVLDQLKEMSNAHTGQVKSDLRSIIITLRGQLQVDEKMEIFQENIEQVNREFYTTLNKEYPDLTKSEKELCGLIRLNLSNKEIASLRNISPKSVKMGRYRLRKKLNLTPEEDIYGFLQEV